MLCVMMLPLVVVEQDRASLSVSACRATTASGVDNAAPPPDWQTPLNGIISPLREADHYAKQLEGTQKLFNEVDRMPISMGNSCNYCEQYTRASSGV